MPRLRYLTAGESHGPALVATLEGLPAGLEVSRQGASPTSSPAAGSGTAARPGWRSRRTASRSSAASGTAARSARRSRVVIHNTEWPKWVDAMDPEPRDDLDAIRDTGRGQRLTRPRPGHADLTAALKYGYDDVRDALERASARETAARVVVGTLRQAPPRRGRRPRRQPRGQHRRRPRPRRRGPSRPRRPRPRRRLAGPLLRRRRRGGA